MSYNLRPYYCFYNGKSILVHANSSYDAQKTAVNILKPRRAHLVTVVLADKPISTGSVG